MELYGKCPASIEPILPLDINAIMGSWTNVYASKDFSNMKECLQLKFVPIEGEPKSLQVYQGHEEIPGLGMDEAKFPSRTKYLKLEFDHPDIPSLGGQMTIEGVTISDQYNKYID